MNTSLRTETFRRRDNGTIDLDFYRARALSERHAAFRAAFQPTRRMIRPAIIVVILAFTVWAIPPVRPSADHGATLVASAVPQPVPR